MRPGGHGGNEHRSAAHGRERHGTVRRPHEVRQVARHRPARRPDDAHPLARHLALLARPAERRQQGARVGGAGALLAAAAEVPGDALPGRHRAHALPEAAHEADGHPQSERGALAGAAQGQSGGHPAAHAGGARPAQLTATGPTGGAIVAGWRPIVDATPPPVGSRRPDGRTDGGCL